MIDAQPEVAYIATLGRFGHTKSVGGTVAADIHDAKNVVFCFGIALPNPHLLSVRPRSIGVADLGDRFHLTFLEPPMPVATQAMEGWCRRIADRAPEPSRQIAALPRSGR